MAPRLRVLAGTSPSTMVPITPLVNTPKSYPLRSPLFEGAVVVHIKGLTDEQGRVRDSEYFEREERRGVTWSIQVQGRFLVPMSADDVLFGNTFDRPLKLPWGTSAVLKFMHYIDPTLEHDLTSTSKPWALSPLISTMPHFMHTRISGASPDADLDLESKAPPPFPPPHSIQDFTEDLYLTLAGGETEPEEMDDGVSSLDSRSRSASSASSSSSASHFSVPAHGTNAKAHTPGSSPPSSFKSSASSSSSSSLSGSKGSKGSKGSRLGTTKLKDAVRKVRRKKSTGSLRAFEEKRGELKGVGRANSASQRRGYFAQRERRRDVVFGPEDVITTDFCYGFLNFSPSLTLQLPGGLSFDLMRFWEGQPVRFVCCERRKSGGEGGEGTDGGKEPWGRIFWCVAIEIVDDDEEGSSGEERDVD